jgi:hypothetical protein
MVAGWQLHIIRTKDSRFDKLLVLGALVQRTSEVRTLGGWLGSVPAPAFNTKLTKRHPALWGSGARGRAKKQGQGFTALCDFGQPQLF